MEARQRPIRVTLVDDHQLLLDALVADLGAEADIEIVGTASTRADGVALIEREQPDVAVFDEMLPDGEGSDVPALIAETAPSTRVLLMTGLLDERTAVKCIRSGCAGLLTKDRPLEELGPAIRSIAAGGAVFSPEALGRALQHLSSIGAPDVGADLTARERELLGLLAEGLSNREMAERLTLSLSTVRNHVQAILSKLQAHSKLEAVATAARAGLIRVG